MRKALFALLGLLFAGFTPLPAQDAEAVLKLKNQIIDLQNKGTLAFKDFTLCAKVLGFGSYVPLEQPAVRQSAELLVYYEPVNVFTNRVKGQFEIWYTQDIVLQKLLSFRYTSRSPVFDLYATNSLDLGDLPPGKYTYQAVLRDKLKEAVVEYTLPFQVIK